MNSQSTKVDELLAEGRAITNRLLNEVNDATRTWCIVEAFNGRDEVHRVQQHRTITQLGLGSTAGALIKGLSRDTLASLLRITDPSGEKGQRHTFCRIPDLLDNPDVLLALEEESRNWEPNWGQDFQEQNVSLIRTNQKFVRELVPATWKGAILVDGRLEKHRKFFLPLRNSILAHSEDYREVQQPSFTHVREFLKLVAELQAACSFLFLGSSHDIQQRWDKILGEAHEFWDLFENPKTF